MNCPKCSTPVTDTGRYVFVEFGEFDGKSYDCEGDCEVHRCPACKFQFIDLTHWDLDSKRSEEPDLGEGLPPQDAERVQTLTQTLERMRAAMKGAKP